MKKILLSIVFVVASLLTMAQEETALSERGEMVRKNYSLFFIQDVNKVLISDEELTIILDEDTFDTYCSGRRKYKIGNTMAIGAWAGLGGGIAIGVPGFFILREHMKDSLGGLGCIMFMAGSAFFIAGTVMIPVGYIHKNAGVRKINSVVNDYNQNIRKTAFHYQFAPTVMPVNIPQSQGHMAYGMTFSVKF